MRPDALRPATKKAASKAKKLKTRLSRGEKRDRKRIAETAVVYDAAPVERTAAAIFFFWRRRGEAAGTGREEQVADREHRRGRLAGHLGRLRRGGAPRPRSRPALGRALDGANHQIDIIRSEAKRRGIEISVVVDLVHVMEYVWGATWCFFSEGDPAAEAWVAEEGSGRLGGQGRHRRRCDPAQGDLPRPQPKKSRKKEADDCARYLKNKAPYLDYPKALANGWPIATGVIEGACCHLVRDRFDITGARWSLEGAEAMLKLRAVRANGDWPSYWRYHLAEEHKRVHESRYADGVIPQAASIAFPSPREPHPYPIAPGPSCWRSSPTQTVMPPSMTRNASSSAL